MESPPDRVAPATQSFRDWLVAMPRWKKVTVAVGLATMVTGGVLSLIHGDAHTPASRGSGALASSLLPDQTGSGSVGSTEPAAKGVFRLGFSFVAGFCIGSFLRATLKVAAIAFGFWLLFTMFLSYFGVLHIDWQGVDVLWNRFTSAVEHEWGTFQTFITGSLPSAGLVVTGLAIGLRRH